MEELRRRHAAAETGGGEERRARQHQEGKLSARERIDLLLDEGTFEEMDKLVRHRSRTEHAQQRMAPVAQRSAIGSATVAMAKAIAPKAARMATVRAARPTRVTRVMVTSSPRSGG